MASVAALVHDVSRDAALAKPPSIGVGMPGSVTYLEGGQRSDVPLVKNSNTLCLNGRPFRRDLVAAVGQPIAFANDANCFALAEAKFGAARGAKVAFGVIMGTGVGGGIAFCDAGGEPRAWDGAQGIAGEWGHISLEPRDGPLCYCGRRGCVETLLSGPAIERAYRALAGEARELPQIVLRRGEDAAANAVIGDALRSFGRALATVINILDPDVVVLGGGVSNVGALYDEGPGEVAKWVFNDELRTRIVRNELGDSAGVIGAALLS